MPMSVIATRLAKAFPGAGVVLQRFSTFDLHGMNVTEPPQFGLGGGFAILCHLDCQRWGDKLQMRDVQRAKSLIQFSLIAMQDPPHDETDGILRCAQQDRFERGCDGTGTCIYEGFPRQHIARSGETSSTQTRLSILS